MMKKIDIPDRATASKSALQVPTQVANARRASWRTFTQTVVALIPLANGVLVTVQSFLNEHLIENSVPPWVFAIVNVSVLVGAYFAKLVAQLMAHPSVNRWIENNTPALAPSPPTR
jgi:hypothetical protein